MRQDEQRVDNDHPEAVRSAPVPVPPATSGGTAAEPDDRTEAEDTTSGQGRVRPWDRRPGDDEGEFHKPGPVPTAFGATSVGGAVAASALASPLPEDEPDPREERTARPGDGAVGGEREGRRADPTGQADGPEDPGASGYGSADPELVDPDAVPAQTEKALSAAARPTATAVPSEPATLFDHDTAQGFRDRWRDVQLRFVDDPKAAAGDAQSLVDEAIQALAAALRAQKEKLGGWQDSGSADTEQLRMAVRQYRDFLDRVLGR
ncbi:hypothetical protein GA0070616_1503 [Micromonospora nigra]|uniref:Uncharacterized protein n=1 Tax=Micromonospora nigra TaxID=145857 RepID=A0A1C6RN05_9ACTN|nr:hypothetical protein [Micromonospora nigra]SCL18407.1 hypothetical protein GA0070616_1503 [Micromonospora nigra]